MLQLKFENALSVVEGGVERRVSRIETPRELRVLSFCWSENFRGRKDRFLAVRTKCVCVTR